MSNIKDVAQRAGVSVPTAYKALGGTYYTSPEICNKVFAAAEELGYVHKASKINGESSDKVIAIVLDEIINPFYSNMVKEMSKELENLGYRLIVMYSNNNQACEKADFELILKHKINGAIFIPSFETNEDTIRHMIVSKFPMLQLFRDVYNGVDTLLIDDELGAYLAVQYLIQNGHRKIMLIAKTHPSLVKREKGYMKAFEEAGISYDSNWLYLMNYDNCTKAMIKQKIHEISPTAILSVGENIGTNVIQSLNEMNLSIPDDVSLISYDDFAWTATYGITAIAHSYESIGRLAAQMMHARFMDMGEKNRKSAERLILDPYLISRNSVKILGGRKDEK